MAPQPGLHRIRLPSTEILDQEEIFTANGIIGKVIGRHAVQQELEEVIFEVCHQRPAGVLMYSEGKLQAIMQDGEAAQRLVDSDIFVHRCPVHLKRWTAEGCVAMGDMDKNLFWAKFLAFPPQCFKGICTIGNSIGKFMALCMPLREMLNGMTLTICVQLADGKPLQQQVEVEWTGADRALVRLLQVVEYGDIADVYDHCRRQGHYHRLCAGVRALPPKDHERTWADQTRWDHGAPEGRNNLERKPTSAQEHPQPNSRARPTVARVPAPLPVIPDRGINHVRNQREDKKVFEALFPGSSLDAHLTIKVRAVIQREVRAVPELWLSQDRHRRQFPATTLDNAYVGKDQVTTRAGGARGSPWYCAVGLPGRQAGRA